MRKTVRSHHTNFSLFLFPQSPKKKLPREERRKKKHKIQEEKKENFFLENA